MMMTVQEWCFYTVLHVLHSNRGPGQAIHCWYCCWKNRLQFEDFRHLQTDQATKFLAFGIETDPSQGSTPVTSTLLLLEAHQLPYNVLHTQLHPVTVCMLTSWSHHGTIAHAQLR